MTREDIKKAAHEFPMNIDGDDLIVVDFAVAMVRRHNEELTTALMPMRQRQFARGINLAIQVIREAVKDFC